MNDSTSFDRDQLLALLEEKDEQLRSKDTELKSYRQQLRDQDVALQTKDLEIFKAKEEAAGWKLAYDKLMQQVFRRRSERYLDNPDQLRFDFGDTDEAADAAEGLADAIGDQYQTIPEHRRRRPGKKRDESLPAHFPRYEKTAELDESQKMCPEHGERQLLPESMWDRTETMEYEPPKGRVRVTLFPKYACPGNPACGIVSPERPVGLVEGNKYDTSVAAEIITGKYGYHLPLYRLQDFFAGTGWTPSRSTQCNILTQAYFVLEPVLAYFKGLVQQDSVVGTDDTRVTLLLPKHLPELDLENPKERRIHEVLSEAIEKGKPSLTARMWAYRGAQVKLNVFDFTVSRHRDGPELFFADYEGTLLGDCWGGFESIVASSGGSMVRAACNAHARRKIFDSQAYPEDRHRWLSWYQELYDIEDRGATMSAEDRLALRRSEARPIWEAMEAWFAEADDRISNVILPKSDFGKAIQYIRNHFGPLRRYLDDPRVPIDNNETEQLMKHVALGRKNWLFIGSIAGGERAAGFLSLVSSALRNDLDVWHYVKDVLDELLAGRTDYEPLLPWNWAAAHPESVREYRVKERRRRFKDKRARRAARRALNDTS